jgi:hypothetical protein
MKIEFLEMDGCPNVSAMWASLQQAIEKLGGKYTPERIDIISLSGKEDRRAGYGSPTILVNGKDLLGSPLPDNSNPSCRYYPGGVPGSEEITSRLKDFER